MDTAQASGYEMALAQAEAMIERLTRENEQAKEAIQALNAGRPLGDVVGKHAAQNAMAEIERLRDENARLRAERDEWAEKWKVVRRELAALKYPGGTGTVRAAVHDSDCATHNEPAYPAGACDCSVAIAKLHAELNACAAALPGPIYMDLPDGGSVTVAEQLARMAEDAARYRWLREQAMNPRRGLESFVATQQLDHIHDTAKIDAAVDAAMRRGE